MQLHLPRAAVTAAAATGLALALGDAGAAVGAPNPGDADGTAHDIAYGASGNVTLLQPFLFVGGLGTADNPQAVAALTAGLSFGWSVSGAGSGQMLLHYRLDNASTTDTWNDLRFMVAIQPDGNQADFLDRVSEAWGAAAPGEPARREVAVFSFDPTVSIASRILVNNNLTDAGPASDCAAVAGCDATLGLQWNVATLGPQQRLEVIVSLSDTGQALSSRWVEATDTLAAGTALRVSGLAVVSAVPEPPAAFTALAGLGMIGAWWRRRRSLAQPRRR